MAKQKFSYTNAIQEIEAIINQLENSELDIDSLSEKVKKATSLIKNCKSKLRETESHLTNILEDDDN
jgi:exodeoxyribonuclease VII small subunit